MSVTLGNYLLSGTFDTSLNVSNQVRVTSDNYSALRRIGTDFAINADVYINNPQYLCISSDRKNIVTINSNNNVIYSTDYGVTWSLPSGISTSYKILLNPLSPLNFPNVFYVVCSFSTTYNLYRSSDGGANWSVVYTTTVYLLANTISDNDDVLNLLYTTTGSNSGFTVITATNQKLNATFTFNTLFSQSISSYLWNSTVGPSGAGMTASANGKIIFGYVYFLTPSFQTGSGIFTYNLTGTSQVLYYNYDNTTNITPKNAIYQTEAPKSIAMDASGKYFYIMSIMQEVNTSGNPISTNGARLLRSTNGTNFSYVSTNFQFVDPSGIRVSNPTYGANRLFCDRTGKYVYVSYGKNTYNQGVMFVSDDYGVTMKQYNLTGTTIPNSPFINNNGMFFSYALNTTKSYVPPTPGTKPTIISITPGSNQLTVTYSASTGGFPSTPTYYYSIDSSTNTQTQIGAGTSYTITGLTLKRAYTIYIFAKGLDGSNPLWTINDSSSATPYYTGSAPTINSVTAVGENNLRVTFSNQSTAGNPSAVTYWYSSSSTGSSPIGPVTSPFDISTTTAQTVYMVATNSAGNSVSSGMSGTPNVKGSIPTLTLTPGINKLTVNFSQTTTGTPSPAYYYSYSNTGSPAIGPVTSPFDISNITTAKTVYIVASNAAGYAISSGVTETPYYTGSAPTINSVVATNANNLVVTFSNQITPGNPSTTTYYYSFDSSGTNPIGPVTSPFNISTTIARTVYMVATNAAGVVVSNGITRSPNVKGSIPTLTLTPGINKLTVNFSQTTTGTPSPEYYYSYSNTGSPAIGPVTSPFDISNITTAKTVYIDASNAAGHVFSSGVTETPYYTGSAPTITSVVASGLNNLRVTFSNQITPGNPSITTYYYSFDGSSPIGPVTSPFDISTTTAKTVYIGASNAAGIVVSSGMSGTPYISGTNPTIDSIVPGLNKLTVSYSGSTGGNPTATYYYSLDGSTNLVSIGTGTTPFVIAGLTNVSHSVSIVAKGLDLSSNTIWTSNSSTSYSTPYGAGTTPSITQITPGTNQLTIYYNQSTGGYPDPTYYYSVDGSTNPQLIGADGSYSTSVLIPSLSNQSHSIYILAKGLVSGNPVWTSYDISYATPHYTGSKPEITGITPGANKLTVNFSQSTLGTSPTAYYYSFDGTTQNGPANYPAFDISNLTQQTTVYIIASNAAGTMVSDPSSSAPILFSVADPPTNVTVTPLLNSLKIDFTKSSGGNPDPTYYYSLDNAPYQFAANPTDTSFVIPNLTTATMHTIQLKGDSIAGPTSVVTVTGEPLIIADPPTNVTVTPLLNSLKIDFTKSSGGNPDPTYYYSLDNAPYQFAAASTDTSFAIPNLTTLKYYNINFRGNSTAGSTSVVSVTGQPYINGTTPTVTSITPGINHMTVAFTSSGGNPDPVYYYSLDGLNPVKIGSYSSPIDISGVSVGPHTVTILVYAIDASNNKIWESSSNLYNGTSYGVGTKPTITSITPGNNSLFVAFSSSAGGNPEATYYYSLDGSSSLVTIGKDASSVLISELTSATHTVAIVARGLDVSSAVQWTNISDASSATPYYKGSIPAISDIVPGTNKLTVAFSQSSLGTSPTTYYYSYSADGSNPVRAVTSPFDISNITQQKTVYVVASNIAGNLVSTGVTGTPNVFGATPSVSVTPGPNKLTVSFSQSSLGTSPTTYYYSYSADGSSPFGPVGPINPLGPVTSSSFDISNITQPKIVYIVASNPAGNLISNGVTGTPYILGNAPSIDQVTSNTNSLQVSFSQTVKGTSPTAYYYSYSADGANRMGPVVSPFYILGLSNQTYTVYLVASNPAGNVVSTGVAGTPNTFGSTPSVSVTPGLKKLTFSFSQSVLGTSPTTYSYSYSADGSDPVRTVTSPFDISNITQSQTIYIVASNPAGNIVSNAATGAPYILGSNPTGYAVSGTNKVTISFSQSVLGTSPTEYYYSYSSNGSNRIGTVTSPFDILNITTSKTIYIVTSNPAGNVVSDGIAGTPNVVGSKPVITNLTPGINNMRVSFSQSNVGSPASTYHYSYQQTGPNYNWLGPVTSPFYVSGLTNTTPYSFYILATNVAGNVASDVSYATPEVFGSKPIVGVVPGNNKLTVSFSQTTLGTSTTTYHYFYLVDGSNQVGPVGPVESPFDMSGLSNREYTIYVVASNDAGNIASDGVKALPYFIGNPPTITGIVGGMNRLTVQFAGSFGGNPAPTYYYYSLDGGPYTSALVSNSQFVVPDLINDVSYSVTMIAQNIAGYTAASNTLIGKPKHVGDILETPVISHAESGFNVLIIHLEPNVVGPTPTYYTYSIDQVNYILAEETASPIIITGLKEGTVYTVTVKSHTDSGDSIASDEYGAMTLSVTGFYRELYKGSIRFRALIIGPNPIHKQSLIRKFR